MHKFEIKPNLFRILVKLSKKDKNAHEAVMDKIEEVNNSYDIEHYKNLKYGMKNYKRVHVGHFVLIFTYDRGKDIVSFEDYDHHDNIYSQ